MNKEMKKGCKPDPGSSSTLAALHYENFLECMTTCEVALSLFCPSVLQQHAMCGAVDGCLVLLFYLSISAAMGSTNKIATCSVCLFEEVKDMRKCRMNGGNKDTDPL